MTTKHEAPDKDKIMEEAGFLPATRAAQLTGTALATIHRWANDGEVMCQHIGKRLYISQKSLAERLGPIVAKALGLTPKEPK